MGGTIAPTGADLGAVVPVASAEFLGESARRTEELSSGRMTFVMSIEGSGLFDGEIVRLDQQFDTERGLVSYSVTPGGALGELAGIDERQAVVDRETVYLKSKRVAAELGVATTWVRFRDPCGASDALSNMPFGGADASSVLEALGAAGDVEEVGTEEIDGRRVKHYRGEVDLARGDGGTGADVACPSSSTMGSVIAPMDVWIDEAVGVVLREEIRVGLEEMMAASGEDIPKRMESMLRGTVLFELTFRDLGAPVTIRLPVPSQVTDVTKADVDRAEAVISQRAVAGGAGGAGGAGTGGLGGAFGGLDEINQQPAREDR